MHSFYSPKKVTFFVRALPSPPPATPSVGTAAAESGGGGLCGGGVRRPVSLLPALSPSVAPLRREQKEPRKEGEEKKSSFCVALIGAIVISFLGYNSSLCVFLMVYHLS